MKNIGCAWAAVWFWMGNGFNIYLMADGAPSAYIAWVWVVWTLLCILVPVGLVIGLGLAIDDNCDIRPNGVTVIIAGLSAALSLAGIIAGLMLEPLAHHISPKLLVGLSTVLFAASAAAMIIFSRDGKEKGHE